MQSTHSTQTSALYSRKSYNSVKRPETTSVRDQKSICGRRSVMTQNTFTKDTKKVDYCTLLLWQAQADVSCDCSTPL